MKVKKTNWKEIGVIGVDSGCVLLADPCYWLKKKDYQKTVCSEWGNVKEIPYSLGHMGKGVLVRSGLGDGTYSVKALIENVPGWGERVIEIRIKFI